MAMASAHRERSPARRANFWQDRGRLDRRIAAADLMDLSFIGEETILPPSSYR
jgi:hypothetical protein